MAIKKVTKKYIITARTQDGVYRQVQQFYRETERGTLADKLYDLSQDILFDRWFDLRVYKNKLAKIIEFYQ